jgi:heme-degrading monooxygenase HmoA
MMSNQYFIEEAEMNHPEIILLVRFKSALSIEEFAKVAQERSAEFEALDGLQQKYYLQETSSGEYAGLYLWESPDALAEYRDSELRAIIAKAHQVQGEPQVIVYKVIKTLRDEID